MSGDHSQTSPRTVMMIAYDGSPDADRAIEYAGKFLNSNDAFVVTAWEPGSASPARLSSLAAGFGPPPDTAFDADIDGAIRAEAQTTNKRGLELAAASGLAAKGSLVEVESTVWGALVAAADALNVDLLVTGTRGASGLRALLHSSVAQRVLQHCHRPVFVVPAHCDQPPAVQP
ncbi:universal stress protein [Gordonia sp. CPCC 205333]|uniref:universal stress protein n=1 Tax=Gordonia sp. CPCC 205333 TaxID=3140790 RepID=UPI003AF39997